MTRNRRTKDDGACGASATRIAGKRARVLLGTAVPLIAALTLGCSGDEEDSGPATPKSDISLGLGDGDGDPTGGIDSNQDGGRTDLSNQQVDAILGAACTGWTAEGELLPATLQLVVDVSGSMDQAPPGGGGGRTKWQITRDALSAAIDSLPPNLAVGMLLYPNRIVTSFAKSAPGAVNECVDTGPAIGIAPLGNAGSQQRNSLDQALQSASVESFTPTHDAYNYALEELLVPYQGPNKYVLLITDGAPTLDLGCTWPGEPAVTGLQTNPQGVLDGTTPPIIAQVRAALDDQAVRTFLIGAPGSEQSTESGLDMRPWLSEAAQSGGTATAGCSANGPNFCHFDMSQGNDFAAELTAGLAAISGQIVDDCTFNIPDAPIDSEDGSVDLAKTQLIVEWGDGTQSLIHPDGNGDCQDGWEYNSADRTVVLCDQTCEEVTENVSSTVHVSFGCTIEEIDQTVH